MAKFQEQGKQAFQSAFAVYNSGHQKKSEPTICKESNPNIRNQDNRKRKLSQKELLAQLENSTDVLVSPKTPIEDDISVKGFKKRRKQKKQNNKNVSVSNGGSMVSLNDVDEIPQKLTNKKAKNTKVIVNSTKQSLTQLHGNDKEAQEERFFKKNSKQPTMPSCKGDSEKDGQALLQWLIQPFTLKKFFDENWEKKPLLLKRKTTGFADGIFSTDDFNRILKEGNVRYDVNLDITTYQNGVRETHNVEGRAFPSVVWDYYNNGCSIRLKNPQSFSTPVWKLCSTLQEYFKSMVGANVYLTPPGTQGFAPHYDDIEAFVLQLEGKKHWSLYNPKSPEETLPRYSSKNFNAIEIGEEIFTTVLSPGDLLYFPRGFIHQARSLPDEHSLHITISTYQKNSWGDFLEHLVPAALSKAISEDVSFRKGLPRDYLSHLGLQNSDKNQPRRKEILSEVSSMVRRLADFIEADQTADVLGSSFLYDALPPVLSKDEMSRSVHGASVELTSPGCPSACLTDIGADTKICIVRKNALRVSLSPEGEIEDETESIRVYHSVQNSRVYHEEEKKCFDVDQEFGPALEYLIHSYPKYIPVKELPLEEDDEKVQFAISLYEKGLLLTEKPVGLTDAADE